MSSLLNKAWAEVVRPLIKRPNRFQVAALCYRGKGDQKEVLLITSRGTGRWILPKGWPIDGMNAAEAALQEAWEEAGVKPAKIGEDAVGEFDYVKHFDEGMRATCSAKVFKVKVASLEEDYPEKTYRTRKWVPAQKAAGMVDEKGLKALLRSF